MRICFYLLQPKFWRVQMWNDEFTVHFHAIRILNLQFVLSLIKLWFPALSFPVTYHIWFFCFFIFLWLTTFRFPAFYFFCDLLPFDFLFFLFSCELLHFDLLLFIFLGLITCWFSAFSLLLIHFILISCFLFSCNLLHFDFLFFIFMWLTTVWFVAFFFPVTHYTLIHNTCFLWFWYCI